MRRAWYLSSCDTCKRIMKSLPTVEGLEWQDIKKQPITLNDLEIMRSRSGSFEALFSKKSRNYRARGLHDKVLTESEMEQLILEDYTFLKRPVVVWDEDIFIGNSPSVVSRLQEALSVLKN